MLCVVGDLVEDVIVRPLAAGRRSDTDNPAAIERRRGGSAANVAAAAAAIGTAVRFIGRVGADAAGAALVAELAAAGVDVRAQRVGRTGTIVVMVEPGGVRTMFPDRGASAELGPIDPAWGDGVSWLHVPGYTWCTPVMADAASELLAAVRAAADARLSIDVSSVAVVDEHGPVRFRELLAALAPDVVLATRAEAERLGDLGTVPYVVVIKDGARPVTIVRPGGRVTTVAVAPVAEVVDPTGAGDAFAAGYVTAAIAGAAPEAAVTAGARLAARVLARVGASL